MDQTSDIFQDNVHASMEAVLSCIGTIASCEDSQKIHAVILEQLASLTEATGGSLFAFEKGALVLKHAIGLARELPNNLMFPLRPKSPSSLVLGAKKPLLVPSQKVASSAKGNGWSGYHDDSFMVLPIMDAHLNILCLVNLHNKKEPPFTQLDLDMTRVLVASAGPHLAKLGEYRITKDRQIYLLELLHGLPGGFVLFERDGTILDTNRSFAALLDLDPDSCLGLNFLDMSPEGDWTQEQTALEEALIHGLTPTLNKTLLRHDMSVVSVRAVYSAFLDPDDGKILAVVLPL